MVRFGVRLGLGLEFTLKLTLITNSNTNPNTNPKRPKTNHSVPVLSWYSDFGVSSLVTTIYVYYINLF